MQPAGCVGFQIAQDIGDTGEFPYRGMGFVMSELASLNREDTKAQASVIFREGLKYYTRYSQFEDEEEEFVDLNEAEEIMRQLRKERPQEYERISNLRDGIRAAKPNSQQKGLYVFCQADRYQQLFLPRTQTW